MEAASYRSILKSDYAEPYHRTREVRHLSTYVCTVVHVLSVGVWLLLYHMESSSVYYCSRTLYKL
jgi:hypothetical protein